MEEMNVEMLGNINMEGKIIVKEMSPEECNFDFAFDDDYIRGNLNFNDDSEFSRLYIVGRECVFNETEYYEIVNTMEYVQEYFSEITGKCNYRSYDSYKQIMEDYDISYSPKKCHQLKALFDIMENSRYRSETENVAEYLTITTGKRWCMKSYHGYCQGDYCEVVYCTEYHSEESVDFYGKMWLGCGTKFCIDDCCGYYLTDDDRRNEDNLRNKLAEISGYKAEDLIIYLYDGSYVTTHNKYKTI